MISGITPNTSDQIKKVFKFIKNDLYARDLITKTLNIHADNRPKITDIMKHGFFKDINWDKVIAKEYKPFFVPKIEDFFDTQYFEGRSESKHKALYIVKQYETEPDQTEEAKIDKPVKPNKFNFNLTQDMKNEVGGDKFEQNCKPLGDFKLFRINQLLKDF